MITSQTRFRDIEIPYIQRFLEEHTHLPLWCDGRPLIPLPDTPQQLAQLGQLDIDALVSFLNHLAQELPGLLVPTELFFQRAQQEKRVIYDAGLHNLEERWEHSFYSIDLHALFSESLLPKLAVFCTAGDRSASIAWYLHRRGVDVICAHSKQQVLSK